jgi:hypothetical protein
MQVTEDEETNSPVSVPRISYQTLYNMSQSDLLASCFLLLLPTSLLLYLPSPLYFPSSSHLPTSYLSLPSSFPSNDTPNKAILPMKNLITNSLQVMNDLF